MTKAAANANAGNPRMIRFLAELDISSEPLSPTAFAQRLAQLIDLPNSLKLSAVHSARPKLLFEPGRASAETVKREFLRVHALITAGILDSFAGKGQRQWAQLPGSDALSSPNPEDALRPFLDFYTLHRKQMSAKAKWLRSHVRDAATGLSLELAQLAQLDLVLTNALTTSSRHFLSKVEPLLIRRYTPLLNAAKSGSSGATDPGAAMTLLHTHLCEDLQSLLLAEVEVHLLPVLGLVEAIDEETN